MHILRKLLLLIIILLFSWILYRLIQKRMDIIADSQKIRREEGFTDKTVTKLEKGNTTNLQISNLNLGNLTPENGITKDVKRQALSLKNYCIKSSYNTAYNGEIVALDMVDYVLGRGCRYLDLEIYLAVPTPIESAPAASTTECAVVSYSADSTALSPSVNKLALSDVLTRISQTAFSTPTPNTRDPLFIQLRVRYKDPDQNKGDGVNKRHILYQSVADSIKSTIINQIYVGDVGYNTNIKSIMGKVVFVMDNSIFPTWKKYDISDKVKLQSYINMETSDTVYSKTFINTYSEILEMKTTPPVINSDGYTTKVWNSIDTDVLQQVVPGYNKNNIATSANYNVYGLIKKYGIQITPMLFWSNDHELLEYEKIFNDSHSAFSPLSNVLRYVQTKNVIRKINYP